LPRHSTQVYTCVCRVTCHRMKWPALVPQLGLTLLDVPKTAPAWLRHVCARLNDAVVDVAFCPQLNRCRRKHGLPAASRVYHRFFLCSEALAMFPPWFAPPHPAWPLGVHQVGFPVSLAAAAAETPQLEPEVAHFLDHRAPGLGAPYVFIVGRALSTHHSRLSLQPPRILLLRTATPAKLTVIIVITQM